MRSLQHVLTNRPAARTAGIDRKLGCVCQFSAQVAASWSLHHRCPAARRTLSTHDDGCCCGDRHFSHRMRDSMVTALFSADSSAAAHRRFVRSYAITPGNPRANRAAPTSSCSGTPAIHQSHRALAESNEWHAHIYRARPAFRNGRRLLQPRYFHIYWSSRATSKLPHTR